MTSLYMSPTASFSTDDLRLGDIFDMSEKCNTWSIFFCNMQICKVVFLAWGIFVHLVWTLTLHIWAIDRTFYWSKIRFFSYHAYQTFSTCHEIYFLPQVWIHCYKHEHCYIVEWNICLLESNCLFPFVMECVNLIMHIFLHRTKPLNFSVCWLKSIFFLFFDQIYLFQSYFMLNWSPPPVKSKPAQ